MRLKPNQKIHEAASKEPGRFAMDSIKFEDGNLVASDGRILALVPVENSDHDEPGLVPRHVFVELLKGPKKEERTLEIEPGSVVGRRGSMLLQETPVEGEFPRYRDLIPAESGRARVTVSVDLLTRLTKALGAESIDILIGDPNQPVLIVAREDGHRTGAVGVVMPIMVEES